MFVLSLPWVMSISQSLQIWQLGCFSGVRRNLCDIGNLLPYLP